MDITLPLVLAYGLLDSFNPCAISLLLIYIALMFTLGKDRKTIMFFGLFYILSIYITYFVLGLNILVLFTKIQDIFLTKAPNLVLYSGAALSIIFGLLNLKEYYLPNLPPHIRMPYSVRQKANDIAYAASIPAAILLGVLVGITEFPCSGAVYLTILAYLEAKETLGTGIGYLAIYNLMFVLPLVIIYLLASNRLVVEKLINYQEQLGKKMHLILAAIMIVLGVALFIFF